MTHHDCNSLLGNCLSLCDHPKMVMLLPGIELHYNVVVIGMLAEQTFIHVPLQ